MSVRSKSILLLSLVAIATPVSAIMPRALAFTCTVTGAAAIPGETPATVCARVRTAVERKIAVRTRAAASRPPAALAIGVTIRIDKRSVSARVTQRRDGRLTTFPVIAVDVMDRSVRPRDLDRLAAAIAETVGQSREGR